MTRPKLDRISARVVEGDVDGWDVYFPGQDVAHVSTASHALARLIDIVKSLPFSSVLVIEWEPRTPLGRQIVKVVTS